MLNNHSRGYLQNCCYSKQLLRALLHLVNPPAQTCGSEDILCTHIFLIFPGHPEFWTPLQIPIWGPLLAVLCYSYTFHIIAKMYKRSSLSTFSSAFCFVIISKKIRYLNTCTVIVLYMYIYYLICISLMVNDIEHFICLFAI